VKTRKQYQEIQREAKKVLKSNHTLAAEIANAWAKKHGILFLAKEDNTALEKSGGWTLAMQYKTRKGK
jgi:hypothetical protein